jgi:hypothetical protein
MRSFPEVLRQLHKLKFEYADGESINFHPDAEFMPEDERRRWFKAWTGNERADPSPYLIFGADGTGDGSVLDGPWARMYSINRSMA